jgi:hypothetical protein
VNAETQIGNERERKRLRRLVQAGGLPVHVAMMLGQRIEQIEKHGHDDTADAARSPADLLAIGKRFLQEAADLTHPGERRNLEVAQIRCARAGAMILAGMRRIEREIAADRAAAAATEPAKVEWPIRHREAG